MRQHPYEPSRALDALIAVEVMQRDAADAPAYSSDLAAAWQVVDRILARGDFDALVRADRDQDGVLWYYARFQRTSGILASSGSSLVSVPHAICLAALRLIEKEERRGL